MTIHPRLTACCTDTKKWVLFPQLLSRNWSPGQGHSLDMATALHRCPLPLWHSRESSASYNVSLSYTPISYFHTNNCWQSWVKPSLLARQIQPPALLTYLYFATSSYPYGDTRTPSNSSLRTLGCYSLWMKALYDTKKTAGLFSLRKIWWVAWRIS